MAGRYFEAWKEGDFIAHDRAGAPIFQCTLQEGLGVTTRLDCKAAP